MTFLEGLLSFISPCILPMLPVYLIYFAGESASGEVSKRKIRVIVNAIAFSLGFSTVFITLGVFAGTLGALLSAHRRAVDVTCGVVIVLMGMSFLGWIRLPFKGVSSFKQKIRGLGSAFLFGMVFSLCLTPCVGAFLGAALLTAASEGGAVKGAMLLAQYSLGLAIPFVISAIMIERMNTMFTYLKVHARGVSVFSGALLIVMGVTTAIGGVQGAKAMVSANAGKESISNGNTIKRQPKEEKAMEITLTSANFEAEVLKSDKPVIVDFWATWCGPCRMLAPELEALAKEKSGLVKVGKVNVDENQELCAKYGIMSIPAIFVFKNGRVTAQSVGYQKKADLEALLNK